MIEHEPWRGPDLHLGIEGQRIAIVGYSHHRKPRHPDHENLTIDVVQSVIDGEQYGDSFFAPVAGYFDYDKPAFWNRVMFFNFLPNCIGTTDERYKDGSLEQIECGKARFLRIIGEEKPEKVLVFTTKGWGECPLTQQEEAGGAPTTLGVEFPSFSWGTYAAGAHIVAAFGLRHPQYANGDLMRAAVQHILAMRIVEGFSN